jgi:hypothetical protein
MREPLYLLTLQVLLCPAAVSEVRIDPIRLSMP